MLTGCWSSKEPKEIAYVDSVVCDQRSDGSFVLTVAIMNPPGLGGAGILGGSSGNKNSYVTFTGVGPSFREAITAQSETREMFDFGAQAKAFFLSERFVHKKENMMAYLDMITRGFITDEKPLLIVIQGEHPEKIYDCEIGISSMVGDYVNNLSKHQPKDMAKGVFITVLEFIRDYYTEGKESVTGLISIEETTDKPSNNTNNETNKSNGAENKNYQIKYRGLAAFRDSKLVGFMDANEAQSYNFLVNKIKSAYITVPVGGAGMTVIHIIHSSADIKSKVSDGEAVIDVKIKADAVVSQEGDGIDVSKLSGLKIIQDSFNSEMKQKIMKIVKKVQSEFKSDIFGFGQSLHIQHPDIWKKIKGSWNDDYFVSATVNVTVESDIVMTGQMETPFEMEVGQE